MEIQCMHVSYSSKLHVTNVVPSGGFGMVQTYLYIYFNET